jgi:hypothetical protein
MKTHESPHRPHRFDVARRAVSIACADRQKAYRRKGYRVVIEAWPREQLRWAVFRPRMHTPAATGIVKNMDDAVAGANLWIATDPHGARVT